MTESIITSSWDDGDPLDLKLAELLAQYHVPATFYLPIDNCQRPVLNASQICRLARDFDIGAHTYHHVDLTRVSAERGRREILDGKLRLEEITGQKVSAFCYPMGGYNRHVVEWVKEAGFAGARTIQINTRRALEPYKAGTLVNARNYSWTRQFRHSLAARDPDLTLFYLKNNLCFKNWDQIAIATLDFVANKGGIWHLWGHSWEVDANRDWDKLREVFKRIESLPPRVLRLNNTQVMKVHD